MTIKRQSSNGTASAGVHHIAKVTCGANCLFHEVDQKNDLGNDAFIEFVVEQASTGCSIATQIKSGASYIRDGRFVLPADQKHFEYLIMSSAITAITASLLSKKPLLLSPMRTIKNVFAVCLKR